MELIDRVLQQLYDKFVEEGGLDQTERIIDEDWERVERRAAFCTHGTVRRLCEFCRKAVSPQV